MPDVGEFVSGLLTKHGILNYRTLWVSCRFPLMISRSTHLQPPFHHIRFSQEQYSKKTMPNNNDHIIKPFTLTAREKSLPVRLTDIALSKNMLASPLPLSSLFPICRWRHSRRRRCTTVNFIKKSPVPTRKWPPHKVKEGKNDEENHRTLRIWMMKMVTLFWRNEEEVIDTLENRKLL